MGDEQNRRALELFLQAAKSHDLDTYGSLLHEDAVQEWPQSGERIVGRDNIMAINRNYPGLPKIEPRRIVGSGDLWATEATLDYQGRTVHAASIVEMRDGRIARKTDYFGDPFEAPAWRAQWVEHMSGGREEQM